MDSCKNLMNFKGIMLNGEKSPSQRVHTIFFHLYHILRNDRTIEMKDS